jgi:integrase
MYTALRLGHAATIQWEWVDPQSGRLRFPAQIRTTKNIPEQMKIHPTLLEDIQAIPRERRSGDLMPEVAALYRRDPSAVTKRVQRLIRNGFAEVWRERFGPDAAPPAMSVVQPGRTRATAVYSFHSLRHSFVTMGSRTAPAHVMRELAGHGPMVQHLYQHSHTEEEDAVIDALPRLDREEEKPEAGGAGGRAAELERQLAEVATLCSVATEANAWTMIQAIRGLIGD